MNAACQLLKETNFKSLCFVTTTIFTFYYNSGTPYVTFMSDEDAFQQKDFLISTHKQISYDDCEGKVSFTFEHACAAVQFQIAQTQTIADQGHSITVNSVVLKNVCKRGDYYYDSGWTLGTNADDYTYYTLTNTSIDLSTTYTLLPCQWLFLIPQSQSTIQVEIKYTVDGGAEQSKLIDLGTDSWTAVNSYTINIRVGTSFL